MNLLGTYFIVMPFQKSHQAGKVLKELALSNRNNKISALTKYEITSFPASLCVHFQFVGKLKISSFTMVL